MEFDVFLVKVWKKYGILKNHCFRCPNFAITPKVGFGSTSKKIRAFGALDPSFRFFSLSKTKTLQMLMGIHYILYVRGNDALL
jgi:hypothetical protein